MIVIGGSSSIREFGYHSSDGEEWLRGAGDAGGNQNAPSIPAKASSSTPERTLIV
jgi:hypothetical protein